MMLNNMRPSPAVLDATNLRLRDAVIFRNHSLVPVIGADSNNIRFREFGAMDRFPAREHFWLGAATICIPNGCTTAYRHIVHVLRVSARFKMRGIDATRIVTPMTGAKAFGASIVNRKGYAVGKEVCACNTYSAVAFWKCMRQPRPTFIRPAHINLGPKAGYITGGQFWYIFSHGLHSVLRSVLERWKRCQHTDNSLSLVAWQGGAL